MFLDKFLLTVDPDLGHVDKGFLGDLGRVDYTLMSDQTLMELLVEGFDDRTKKAYQDDHGMYLDVCEWSCVKCNTDERVVEIEETCAVAGSLQLQYVPPKLKVLMISSWRKSQLTGSVDLSQLPEGMQKLCLSNTELKEGIDLAHLPKIMETLSLENNRLTGEIDLTRLPDAMYKVYLHNNQLSGEIDLTHLPDGMHYLNFSGNQLTGSLVIQKLPQRMRIIDVRSNRLQAVAVVDSNIRTIIELGGSGVMSVMDENGREIDLNQFCCKTAQIQT